MGQFDYHKKVVNLILVNLKKKNPKISISLISCKNNLNFLKIYKNILPNPPQNRKYLRKHLRSINFFGN